MTSCCGFCVVWTDANVKIETTLINVFVSGLTIVHLSLMLNDVFSILALMLAGNVSSAFIGWHFSLSYCFPSSYLPTLLKLSRCFWINSLPTIYICHFSISFLSVECRWISKYSLTNSKKKKKNIALQQVIQKKNFFSLRRMKF